MANLPLLTRRRNARGISSYDQGYWRGRKTTGLGNRATLTTAIAGNNNDLFFMAKQPGATFGNAITIAFVNPGTASAALSISVASKAITVNLATNSSSVVTSTATDVAKAIRQFNTPANALVHVNHAPANDGTGVVAAMTATNLTGAV